MARVVCIPDIHLKPYIFDRADRILKSGQADYAVQLGDIVDDWGQKANIEKYNQTMARVKQFYEDHPDTLWCMGNHDFGYYYPDFGPRESGHSIFAELDMADWLSELHRQGWRQEIVHKVDDIIFSHAGLTEAWVNRRLRLADAPEGVDVEEVIRIINGSAPRELWSEDSPIWARPQLTEYEMFAPRHLQVVGHTPVSTPTYDSVLSLDTFSTDSDGNPLGNQKFVVVDTETQSWSYAEEDL